VKKKIFSITILSLILLVHLLYIIKIDSYPYSFDAQDDQGAFQRTAYNIAFFNKFSVSMTDKKYFCTTRSPLYSYLLSTAYFFKIPPILFIRTIQLFLLIGTIILLFFTSKEIGNLSIALMTISLALLDPHFVSTVHLILSENLSIFLLVFFWFLIQKKFYFVTAIISGLLILNRPIFIIFIVMTYLYLLIKSKINFKKFATIFIIIITVLSPWIYLNKTDINRWVVSRAAGSGYNLFTNLIFTLSDYDEIDDISSMVKKFSNIDTSQYRNLKDKCLDLVCDDSYFAYKKYRDSWSTNPPNPSEVIKADQYLKKISLHYILNHKGIIWKMFNYNLKVTVRYFYNPLIYAAPPNIYSDYSRLFRFTIMFMAIITFIFFMKSVQQVNAIVLMLAISLFSIHMFMHTEPRYYIYLYPFIYFYSAVLIDKLITIFSIVIKNRNSIYN